MEHKVFVKSEECSLGEFEQYCESVTANHQHNGHTIDYFNTNFGMLVSRDQPSSLEFSVSLLNEILYNMKPAHELWGKIKYATYLLNLATRNIEFSLLYELFYQIENEVLSNNLIWNDGQVGLLFQDLFVDRLLVKEDTTQEPQLEDSKQDFDDYFTFDEDMKFDDEIKFDKENGFQEPVPVPVSVKKKKEGSKRKRKTKMAKSDSKSKKMKKEVEDDTSEIHADDPDGNIFDEDQILENGNTSQQKPARKKCDIKKTKHFLKCPDCYFRCRYQRTMDRHAFEKHEATRLCIQCGHLSSSFKEFVSHNESHIMTCDLCNKKFLGKKRYDFHMKFTHNISNDADASTIGNSSCEDERTPCDECGVLVKSMSMAGHKYIMHSSKEELHKCDVCGKELRNKYILKNHRQRHFRTMTKCPECGKMVKALANHFRRVCGNKTKERLKCDLCNKTFSLKQGLKRHKLNVHMKIVNHECDHCDFQSYDAYTLKIHVAVNHTKEKIWTNCEICDKRTANMDYHMKTYHFQDYIKKNNDEVEPWTVAAEARLPNS